MENIAILASYNSFTHMLTALPDDAACRSYLESVRWTSGTPTCPHCGTADNKAMQLKTKGVFKGMYKCRSCRERFTVTIGTMFEGSHIPLRKWFIAIYIFSTHKKGISSHQLASDLGVTQKTAWLMLGRIRNAFKLKAETPMSGTVQADETYVGGKNKNRHKDKKVESSPGRSVKDKTPVRSKRLHRYCDEFYSQCNSRKITTGEQFTYSLVNATNTNLTYKELTGKK